MNYQKAAFYVARAIRQTLFLSITFILVGWFAEIRAETLKLEILPGEYWWGGLSAVGHETPYDAASVANYDLQGRDMRIKKCRKIPKEAEKAQKSGFFGGWPWWVEFDIFWVK